MSAAERERLRRTVSGEASYRAGAMLKCAVCVGLIGLLVLIGASPRDGGEVAGAITAGLSSVEAP